MGEEGKPFDIFVVGGGAAGMTAAATAAGLGLRTLLAEHLAAGGQVATVDRIENFPGFPGGIAGYELGPILQQQAEQAGSQFLFDTVESVTPIEGAFLIQCTGATVHARTVIIAAGSSRRSLGVPGEKELEGRGVSHCASCDGPLFRGEDVVVVGGGDSAYDEARMLADVAASVTVVHRGQVPLARRSAVARLEALPNVRTMPGREIARIHGDMAVKAIELDDGSTFSAAAVFAYVGLTPNTGPFSGLVEMDADGRILTDAGMQTSLPGIFAAGDIRAGSGGLLVTAASDGAIAAIAAAAYLGVGAQAVRYDPSEQA